MVSSVFACTVKGCTSAATGDGHARCRAHLESWLKSDTGKSRLDLVPPRALLEVGRVLGHGAAKYGAHNWKQCTDGQRYVAAAMRHVMAYQSGEQRDAESGRLALAHAVASLLFVLELDMEANPQ